MTAAMGGGREAGCKALGGSYRDPPPAVEEFLAGAIVSLAARRLCRGEAENLSLDRPELVRLVATPFIGIEQAARVGRRLEIA